MLVLVTGGAGYVGSVVADELISAGLDVVVFDNLQHGHRAAIPADAHFVLGNICDCRDLEAAFNQYHFDAVIHMAAESTVPSSTDDPKRYFTNNVAGGLNLLNTMLAHNVLRIVYSSTAAVYGEPKEIPIDEEHPTDPINVYGITKLMFEQCLESYGKGYGLKHISLRYFNAAGATKRLGEDHQPETHLIPNLLKAALEGSHLSIFGDDYPTNDGTCVRDYVHVSDIAQAHLLALSQLDSLQHTHYNLGSGHGFSILEVVNKAKSITGLDIAFRVLPRRSGDPPFLVARPRRAMIELGWTPAHSSIEGILADSWDWLIKHPHGFSKTRPQNNGRGE